MKMKYTVAALLIAGVILLCASLILSIVSTSEKNIIGGADLPIFLFVFFSENGGIYLTLALLGMLSIIISLIMHIKK